MAEVMAEGSMPMGVVAVIPKLINLQEESENYREIQ